MDVPSPHSLNVVINWNGAPLATMSRTFWAHRVKSRASRGDAWYEQRFLPRIGPFALYSLLFTIVLLFAMMLVVGGLKLSGFFEWTRRAVDAPR